MAGGPARSWPISPLQVEQQDDISSDVGDVDLSGYRNVHKTRKTQGTPGASPTRASLHPT